MPLVEQELLTLAGHPLSSPVLSGVRVIRSLVLCVVFCRSLFVFLYFFFWPLCCLFFFDIRILITPFGIFKFFLKSLVLPDRGWNPRSTKLEASTNWCGSTLCDEFYQWFVVGRWFSPDTPVSSANKTDRHDINEILLKVALNTIIIAPSVEVFSV